MKYQNLLFPIVVMLSISAVSYSDETSKFQPWPEILPTRISKHVTTENALVVLDVFSRDEPTKALYQLRCNEGDAIDIINGKPGDYYYGMFQCLLLPVNQGGADMLMGEFEWDLNKGYNTRGVFKLEQLIGPCKDDPEFGAHREFNMRRMKLELTLTNFVSPPIIDLITHKAEFSFSFDLEAKISPNEAAISKYTFPSAKKYCGGYYRINADGLLEYFEAGN